MRRKTQRPTPTTMPTSRTPVGQEAQRGEATTASPGACSGSRSRGEGEDMGAGYHGDGGSAPREGAGRQGMGQVCGYLGPPTFPGLTGFLSAFPGLTGSGPGGTGPGPGCAGSGCWAPGSGPGVTVPVTALPASLPLSCHPASHAPPCSWVSPAWDRACALGVAPCGPSPRAPRVPRFLPPVWAALGRAHILCCARARGRAPWWEPVSGGAATAHVRGS